MSIVDMHNRLVTFTDKENGRGATLDEILLAEGSLGVTLPESYRCFLADFGWCRLSYQELYGLGQDVPSHIDLVRNTIAERLEMEPTLPPHLVPVMNDGAGNHYCLDTSNMSIGESPVIFWDHDQASNQVLNQIAVSFDIWILDLLDELTHA